MKTHTLLSGLLLLVSGACAAHAQTSIDLTQLSAVQSNGTYTYYARGNENTTSSNTTGGVSSFTTTFNPNVHGDQSGTGINSFSTGLLTKTNNSSVILGWGNVTQYTGGNGSTTQDGTFDILFNLGSAYVITGVKIIYTDTSGQRWYTGADAQSVYTSLAVPASGASNSSLSLFGTTTAVNGATQGTMTIAGSAVQAQYVDLQLNMIVTPSSPTGNITSVGGDILGVQIEGYAIPEPKTAGLLMGTAGLICAFVKLKK